jgi:insulysin
MTINFDIDYSFNDKRRLSGMILSNGIKIVFVSDNTIKLSSCTVTVGAGSFQDNYEGSAHFLEHLLFMGSTKYPDYNEYHSYIQTCGGEENAFTADDITCYYIGIESAFLEKGIDMLSWFFRDPILDKKYIKSEMNIIDAEHNKNILSDMWITHDMFKKFILTNKFNKFSTGNNESLKNITRDDILNYYNKYYCTDNICVCIVDNIPLAAMTKKYLHYFNDIPNRLTDTTNKKGNAETINKKGENVNFVSEQLMIYSSVSKYNILNIYIPLPYIKKNHDDYIILKFIIYLIATEYETSLSYYLKESSFIKSLQASYDYYYDDIVMLSLYIKLYDESKHNIDTIITMLISYINELKKLDSKMIEKLYNNYRKILMIQGLYKDGNSIDIGQTITINMIYDDTRYALLRDYITPPYSNKILQLIKIKINSIDYDKFKISTNVNFLNINKKEFKKNTYYNQMYTLLSYNPIHIKNNNNNDKNNNDKNNFNMLVPIENVNFNMDILVKKCNVHSIPTRYNYEGDKRVMGVYILDCNKYNNPISKFVIIQQNPLFLQKDYMYIVKIYIQLCYKIINYYISVMDDYHMDISIYLDNECLIFELSGLDNLLKTYIIKIIQQIDIIKLFDNKYKKYFNDILNNTIEIYENNKYNNPYELCNQYLSIHILNNYKPCELIKILKNLNWNDFKKKCNNMFLHNKYNFLIVGNFLNCTNEDSKNKCDNDITNLINMIISTNKGDKEEGGDVHINKFNFNNYTLSQDDINSNEINNCIYKCYLIESKSYNVKDYKLVIKNKLVCNIISELINEPLFTQIRTDEKLGYIVRCKFNTFKEHNNYCFIITYLIQSSFPTKKIMSSIKKFNIKYAKIIHKNKIDITKKIKRLIKSKILLYSKNYESLDEEVYDYINVICNQTYMFDINKQYVKVLKKISVNDIYEYIVNLFNNKNHSFDIIIDTNKI